MLVDFVTDSQSGSFEPYQIVCLEFNQECLYAEVIQIVESRQLCWARPLMLRQPQPHSQRHPILTQGEQPTSSSGSYVAESDPLEPPGFILYDLRQGADLLWPICLFRAAVDTEVLPLYTQLTQWQGEQTAEPKSGTRRQILSSFIRRVWQANPQLFEPS